MNAAYVVDALQGADLSVSLKSGSALVVCRAWGWVWPAL